MIINHKHKFIFIKTRKTAGTSIEIALSELCDNNDIITPISEEDERTRQELGSQGPQNYDVPLRLFSKSDWLRWLKSGKRKQFFNHASAHFIRENVGEKIWRSYFKFCFERNSFDKAISRYYWSTREPRPEISNYLETTPIELLSNWESYTINDQISVDYIGHYENLTDDLAMVADKLNLPGKLKLPRAKGSHRVERSHYSNVLNAEARARIELVCAKEIIAFNYRWNESQDQ